MKQIRFLNRNLHVCFINIERIIELQTVCLTNLDYASSVWDPYHQGDVNKLEMVQIKQLICVKPTMEKYQG